MSILLYPLLISLLLVLIHAYFGHFILKRGILFIDLALAQWAALGYLAGHYFHLTSPFLLFLCAYGATLLASLILTLLTPLFHKSNEQEALIGILYVLASASAIALIATTGMDSHYLHAMFSGHLLFISSTELITAGSLYALIGLIAYLAHAHFLKHDIKSCFIFYGLFGLLVSSSVKLVGLLLVFSFLVIPIFIGSFFFSKLKDKLLFSWGVGILGTLLGLSSSLLLNIPPSYCIILSLIALFSVSTAYHLINSSKNLPKTSS